MKATFGSIIMSERIESILFVLGAIPRLFITPSSKRARVAKKMRHDMWCVYYDGIPVGFHPLVDLVNKVTLRIAPRS